VASLCAVLASEAVVIGGGVAGGLPLLRPHIEKVLAGRAGFIGKVDVLAAQLGEYAGAVGAALAHVDHEAAPAP
jgi:glucokinase